MRYIKALFPLVMMLLIGFHLCFLMIIKPDPALMILAVYFVLAPSVVSGMIIQDLYTQGAK